MPSIKCDFTKELEHILFEFFELDQDDPFIASLMQHGITKLETLLFMPPDVLDVLKSSSPRISPGFFGFGPCNMIQHLQHFHQFHKPRHSALATDWFAFSGDDFDAFRDLQQEELLIKPPLPPTKHQRSKHPLPIPLQLFLSKINGERKQPSQEHYPPSVQDPQVAPEPTLCAQEPQCLSLCAPTTFLKQQMMFQLLP